MKLKRKRCCGNDLLEDKYGIFKYVSPCSGKKEDRKGQASRIVLPLPLCVLLYMELHAVLQQFTLWQKVFRSPVLSKCLTCNKCCIVLAKQQYKCVTIWCLSSIHALFFCDAFVKWNRGALGTHLKDRRGIQPAFLVVRFIFSVRISLPMNLSCYISLLASCVWEQAHFLHMFPLAWDHLSCP